MDIPLWVLLVPLGVVAACTGLFLFFNLFHLWRYGIVGRGATALILIYVISYGLIVVLGLGALSEVDWTSTVSEKDIIPFLNNSSSLNL